MSTACHRHFNHLVPVWRSYPAGPAATEVQLLGAAGNQHLGEMGQKLGQRWGSRVWLEEFPPENRGMDVYRSDFLLPGPATDQPSGTRNLKDSAGTLVSHHTFGHGSLRPLGPWKSSAVTEGISRWSKWPSMAVLRALARARWGAAGSRSNRFNYMTLGSAQLMANRKVWHGLPWSSNV